MATWVNYSRRKTCYYGLESVTFTNKQVSTKFYDKTKQSNDYRAEGILRQETTYRKKAVTRLFGKEKPTLRDVTLDLLLNSLEKELSNLGLYGRSIATRNTALETLFNFYGIHEGFYHYGFLSMYNEQPTKESILRLTNWNPRTLSRHMQKIKDAGLPLTLTDTEEPLPPLFIDRETIYRESLKESKSYFDVWSNDSSYKIDSEIINVNSEISN